ncbi:MAG: hypothetical protein P8Q14_02670 [Vicingaceae bacterium]|nr:hypothetical protein [Vicingaceae bacterium]
MSLITINNYEAYLLDYVEENLSPDLVAELMLFLEQNPELKEDLADFEVHELVPNAAENFDKTSLKKDVVGVDYETLMIAEIEGVNSKKESKLLFSYLAKNASAQKEFEVYQKAKLVAPEIVFENKKGLKKKAGIIIPLYWKYSSAAAAVVIVLWSLNWFDEDRVYYPTAERENVIEDSINDNNLMDNFIIQEEKQFAEDVNAFILLKNQKIKKDKKQVVDSDKIKEDQNIEENQLANLPEKENKEIIDSTSTLPKNNSLEKQADLLAENNVIITYEEEILDDGTPNLQKRKLTKLDLVRAAVKHRVNGNLDKGKEKVLFALNTKQLNFLRKKKNK